MVSLFRLSIEKLGDFVRSIYEISREQPIYLVGMAICCILAAFFVGYLVKNEPDIKGSGIPQVEGQLRGELSMNWFSVLWKKFIGGVLSVGAGTFFRSRRPFYTAWRSYRTRSWTIVSESIFRRKDFDF